MVLLGVLVLATCLHQAAAGLWNRNAERPIAFKASSFAGATTSAIFPPPNATNTGAAIETFFPTDVGFAGPTPSKLVIISQNVVVY
jgi:hypothetical protein